MHPRNGMPCLATLKIILLPGNSVLTKEISGRKDKPSSYQHYISLFENDPACIIYTLCHVHKIGRGLRLAVNGSVPTFTYLPGAENKLPPAIIHAEIIQFLYPN